MGENVNGMSRTERMKRTKKRKWPRVLFVLLLLLGSVFTYGYYRLQQTSDTIYSEVKKDSHPSRDNKEVDLKDRKPFSILLMGIDTGDIGRVDKGRSDTMMVMTVNPTNKKTTIVSIPRDTRTEIVGRGVQDKINHAYFYGGPTMSINTVQELLDIPIDYFVSVNMAGMQQIVDAVGGVSVTPILTFTQDGFSFVKGEKIKVDGEAALAYSRMRKKDPEGDFGRQERQREVVTAILKKGASFDSILNYQSVLKSMEDNLQTNLEFNEMVSIFMNYSSALSTINQIQMTGEDTRIDNIYYLNVSEEMLNEISTELKKELEITNQHASPTPVKDLNQASE